ncbi:MAG: hypothetical protein DME26_21955 [Verrucomicrobia bacterium]|nr:MAG: hypothetical protein DME26_21955 [Verrucomicrobiota bacterium]
MSAVCAFRTVETHRPFTESDRLGIGSRQHLHAIESLPLPEGVGIGHKHVAASARNFIRYDQPAVRYEIVSTPKRFCGARNLFRFNVTTGFEHCRCFRPGFNSRVEAA